MAGADTRPNLPRMPRTLPFKVLIFTTQFYQLGGAERLSVDLAIDLNQNRVHADLLSMYTGDLPGVAEAARDLQARGVRKVMFLGLPIGPGIPALLSSMVRLRRMVRREGYRVVETSSITSTVIAAWALRGTEVRHIVGVHDIFRKNVRSIRENLLRFSLWANRRLRYYAVSQRALSAWQLFCPSGRGKTKCIYNAISDHVFLAKPDRHGVLQELDIPGDARILLFAGRLAARKGLDILVEAAAPLLRDGNAYLLLAGAPDLSDPGTASMLQALRSRIATEPWGHRIRFMGFRDDISRLMASVDVMVHPAFIEAFGLVLAEAMVTGAPIVATNVDGIPEVLDGSGYTTVPPGDAAALRAAILATLDRPKLEADALRERGYRRADDFRQSRRTQTMIELYDDVVSGAF